MISFDNRSELSAYPISSIDFGLGNLGYTAAHVIIGDIRVHADDRHGNIGGKPFLVDRGSL